MFVPFFSKFLYETDLPVLKYSYERKDGDLILKFKWNEVQRGFKMAFGIETSTGNGIRLLGTTEEQTVILEDSDSFNFYNLSSDLTNAPHNSFSYYWTKGDY